MSEAEEKAKSAVGAKCPYCQTRIKRGELIKVCPFCGLPHHWECWRENGGCTTYGCEATLVDRGFDPALAARSAVSGDLPQTRRCRQCSREYPYAETVCPHCGHQRTADLLVSYRMSMASQATFVLALLTVAALAAAVFLRLGVLFYITAPTAVGLTLLSMLLYRRRYFCTACRQAFLRPSLFRPKTCPRCGVLFPNPPITTQN
jgi:Zn finger protein HypA/HybF involved in hydrogenase expression